LNDNAKGNAKSAGAQLRRYGEQSLREVSSNDFCAVPIQLMITHRTSGICSQTGRMRSMIANEFWIRASGANRRIFLDYEEAIITKGDPKVTDVPIPYPSSVRPSTLCNISFF